jgi:putative membrane protein
MNRSLVKERPAASRGLAGSGEIAHLVAFVLFLAVFAVAWLNEALPSAPFGEAQYPEALLLVVGVATSLASLARQLPAQNVLLVAVAIAVLGGAVQTLGALTGIPFGPFVFGERLGPRLFHPLPWAAPLIWVVAAFNSRGVARLILRPWRKMRSYGFWLIGVTAVVLALFDLGLEPFAVRVRQYWIWNPTKIPIDYYGAPAVNFLAWAVVAVLMLAFVTPALINKRHNQKHGRTPAVYHPLIVWLLLEFLFASGAAAQHLWPAAIITSIAGIIVAVFAVRGGTW